MHGPVPPENVRRILRNDRRLPPQHGGRNGTGRRGTMDQGIGRWFGNKGSGRPAPGERENASAPVPVPTPASENGPDISPDSDHAMVASSPPREMTPDETTL